MGGAAMDIAVEYVNVFVTDFDRAVDFYANTLGLTLTMKDEAFKYASFSTGESALAIVETDDAALVGRHTGIGLMVKDLDAAFGELKDVANFVDPPTKQPWGGYMAMLSDPDGNIFYFDQYPAQ
jgi:lactoylglutathione lyase